MGACTRVKKAALNSVERCPSVRPRPDPVTHTHTCTHTLDMITWPAYHSSRRVPLLPNLTVTTSSSPHLTGVSSCIVNSPVSDYKRGWMALNPDYRTSLSTLPSLPYLNQSQGSPTTLERQTLTEAGCRMYRVLPYSVHPPTSASALTGSLHAFASKVERW